MNSYINGIHQIECKTPNIGNLLSNVFRFSMHII